MLHRITPLELLVLLLTLMTLLSWKVITISVHSRVRVLVVSGPVAEFRRERPVSSPTLVGGKSRKRARLPVLVRAGGALEVLFALLVDLLRAERLLDVAHALALVQAQHFEILRLCRF